MRLGSSDSVCTPCDCATNLALCVSPLPPGATWGSVSSCSDLGHSWVTCYCQP